MNVGQDKKNKDVEQQKKQHPHPPPPPPTLMHNCTTSTLLIPLPSKKKKKKKENCDCDLWVGIIVSRADYSPRGVLACGEKFATNETMMMRPGPEVAAATSCVCGSWFSETTTLDTNIQTCTVYLPFTHGPRSLHVFFYPCSRWSPNDCEDVVAASPVGAGGGDARVVDVVDVTREVVVNILWTHQSDYDSRL